MTQGVAVVGLQWGDEGKARVVDVLSEECDDAVRFQGGSNAGHTVVANGRKHVFHLVPAGILHPQVRAYIGGGVVVDPFELKKEVEEIGRNVPNVKERIKVAAGCHLVMPYHRSLDTIYENLKGDERIGTTGRGIGPCYADKALRHGIRAADLLEVSALRQRLETVLPIENALLEKIGGLPPLRFQELMDSLLSIGDWLRPLIADVPDLLRSALDSGRRVLFEGAQSVLLDVDYGTYPYVTSSNSCLTGLFAGAGVHPGRVGEVWGVTKAYCTRVGSGPFITELNGPEGERLRKDGDEYGATTGRPRRCGWLDIPAIRYAAETSAVTAVALTKIDVLGDYDVIRVCTSYRNENHRVYYNAPWRLAAIEPVYREFPGWKRGLQGVRRREDLPSQALAFLHFIEEQLRLPVKMVTFGAAREQTLRLG